VYQGATLRYRHQVLRHKNANINENELYAMCNLIRNTCKINKFVIRLTFRTHILEGQNPRLFKFRWTSRMCWPVVYS